MPSCVAVHSCLSVALRSESELGLPLVPAVAVLFDTILPVALAVLLEVPIPSFPCHEAVQLPVLRLVVDLLQQAVLGVLLELPIPSPLT